MDGFDLGSIVAHVKADTKQFTQGLEGAKAQADGFASKLSTMAVGVAAVADALVVGIGIKSIKAFSESQDMIAQTNAVLKSTGGVAGVTAKMVNDLSVSWERQTKYSDEAVRGAENILLTFTNIHKDTFPQATAAVLNMSTALHEDLQSASIQVGKALQDPVNGITALKRVGVNFTDAQKDVIKHLVETGQTAKAQQLIIAELNREFGGSAKAAGDTYSGMLEKLKNRLDDIEEIIGGKLVAALTNSFNWYMKHQRLVNDLAGVLGTLVGVIAIALVLYGNWIILTKALAAAQAVLNLLFITNPILGVILAIIIAAALIVEHWKVIKQFFLEFWADIKGWFDLGTAAVRGYFERLINDVKRIFNDLVNFLRPIVIVILAILLLPLVPAALAWRHFHVEIMEGLNGLLGFFGAIFNAISGIVQRYVNFYKAAFADAYHFVVAVFSPIVGFFSSIMSAIIGAIKGPASSFGSILFDAGKNLIHGLIRGIESMAGAAENAIRKTASGIEDTAKKILKVFSPSRVFHEIGQNVGQGLVNGINSMQHSVGRASANMAGRAIGPASSLVNTTNSSSVNTSINGPINIGSNVDASNFLKTLTRNQELAMKGLTPVI